MNKKYLKILGIIIAFFLCFPLHNLYKQFPNFVTSIIVPVNESIWEHMKILFGSILLSGIIQKIIVIVKKENKTNICFSNFVAAITSIPIFLIMFLPVYYYLGDNFGIIILIMLVTIIIAELISYQILKLPDLKLENITIVFVIIIYALFTYFTYYPLDMEIFRDPIKLTYGIIK